MLGLKLDWVSKRGYRRNQILTMFVILTALLCLKILEAVHVTAVSATSEDTSVVMSPALLLGNIDDKLHFLYAASWKKK